MLKSTAEIDKEKTYVLQDYNIITVAPNIGFLTEREYSFTAIAEREIARDDIEKMSHIGFDYDTMLRSNVEIDKEETYELPDGNIIMLAPNVAWKCCPSRVSSAKKPADPRHFFPAS